MTATPRMFWERAKHHRAELKALRGDWTDYWNFGCISAARETTVARSVRQRLYRAEAIQALTPNPCEASPWDSPAADLRDRREERKQQQRDDAWRNLILYGEHTWG